VALRQVRSDLDNTTASDKSKPDET